MFFVLACFALVTALTACGCADFVGNSYKMVNSLEDTAKAAMLLYRDVYESTDKGTAYNVVLSDEMLTHMLDVKYGVTLMCIAATVTAIKELV